MGQPSLAGFYLGGHRCQFNYTSNTAANGCVWTVGSIGADNATDGAVQISPDVLHSKLGRWEETNSLTPGWSMPDLHKALARLNVPFSDRGGSGWTALTSAHKAGLYIAVQGDSDQFANDTCSGAFNGLHCVGIHPATKTIHGVQWWWINDPICPTGRWERASVLHDYATKLSSSVHYGVFTKPVARIPPMWGDDVPGPIQAVNRSGWSVGQALTLAAKKYGGHNYGQRINLGDLTAGLDKIGHAWGSVVNPSDVTALIDWWKAHR